MSEGKIGAIYICYQFKHSKNILEVDTLKSNGVSGIIKCTCGCKKLAFIRVIIVLINVIYLM